MLITANASFEAWGNIFAGDAVIASAILDRLLHHSHMFLITGAIYRMKGKISQQVDRKAESI